MEFKGTKGVFESSYIKGVGTVVRCFNKKNIKTICLLKQNNHEDAYNAKLISFAPEMLEMLKDIVHSNNEGTFEFLSFIDIENLINKATTI